MPSRSSTQVLSGLTQPIRRLIVKPESPTPTPNKALPTTWLCHECITILGAAPSVENAFAATHCQGCDHERCGLCDVVYAQPTNPSKPLTVDAGTFDDGDQMMRLVYHWEPSQQAVKAIAVSA